jgi:hypothetical protein
MIRRIAILAAVAAVALTACGSPAPSEPTVVTVTAPPPAKAAGSAPTSTAPKPKRVTLPQVKGRNGGIVYDELQSLGLTNVNLASRDKSSTVVVLPQNWTATKIDPPAGTEVDSDDTVVVTMTKG